MAEAAAPSDSVLGSVHKYTYLLTLLIPSIRIADFISWIVRASTGMLESDDAPAVARSRSMILKTSSF